jgi:hypothetical protein
MKQLSVNSKFLRSEKSQQKINGRYRGPSVWNLTVVTTGASQDYTVDINAGSGINITIDWGDGSAPVNYTTTGQKTNTYANAGTYILKISGSFSSGGNIRFGSNGGNSSRLKSTGIIPLIPGMTSFSRIFYFCTGLTGSIPVDLFRYNTLATTFNDCFRDSTGLTGSIPADLFRYNTLATNFASTFYGCTGLTGSIPADLFRYNTSATDFSRIFYFCTGLTGSIPVDLFRYNTSALDFSYLFQNSGITGSIPVDLFRYNTSVTTFNDCFRDNSGLTGSIPADLFRYNTLATNFASTFYFCSGLTGSIPADLFRYNTLATNFSYCFRYCTKLELSAWIFYPDGAQSTRFATQTPDFSYCFNFTPGGGIPQGTAPDLWNCTYTGTPTRTDCFQGHSSTSLSNWASIPVEWT